MALNTNIKASWHFDESSGNATDSSGNGYTLTNTNTVAYSAGKINNAGDFGSANTNKYFINNSSLTLGTYQSDVWSIRRPVYITTAPTSGNAMNIFGLIATSQAQVNVNYYNNAGTYQIQYTIYNGATAQTMTWNQTFTTGVWYDFWIVKNGTTVTCYVNGSSIGANTITIANGTPSRAAQFTIGKNAFDSANYMSGMVDEVTVYSDVKTLTDITTAYNSGSWLYYPFPASTNPSFFLNFI